jgi:ABC-type lipoprotein export system ATPase subunit
LSQERETPLIILSGVVKIYRQGAKEIRALDQIDLSIPRGEFIVVQGPSGCGKSTLLHLVAGLDLPDEGKVLIAGQDLSGMPDETVTLFRRRTIGIVFQFFHLFPALTAEENVALPLLLNGQKSAAALMTAAETLARVGLERRLRHRPDELSGGEMQRVALARAIVARPEILLADEPTGNLDSSTGSEILGLIGEIHRTMRTTVVLVTHEDRAASLGERLLRMQDGRIVVDGPIS